MLLRARTAPRSAAKPFERLSSAASALVVVSVLVAGGCGGDPEDDYTPNTAPRGLPPAQVSPAAANTPAARQPFRPPPVVDPYDGLTATPKEVTQDEQVVEDKPRDYSAELLAAMSSADSCVKPRPASASLPSELFISLEGLVLESGTVVSGSARAPNLTPEELECVKRRLESTRIPDGVQDAPRRVSTTLKLTFKKAEPAPTQGGANTAAAPSSAAPAPSPAAAQLPPGQTPPEDTSGTRDEPEAVAPSNVPSQD